MLNAYKNRSLLAEDSGKAQDKGNKKGKEDKFFDLKSNEKHNPSDGALGSKKNKNKKFEKSKWSYCMRGFHQESQCMKKTIDQLSKLLEQNNIDLSQGANKSKAGNQTKEHESFHALKESFTRSKAYLIDSGASNHMVASKESFTYLDLSRGPSIHIGDD